MSSRPSRRQVYSPPPSAQPYSSVPLASPPRAPSSQGHGSQLGHYYISQVGGPRPVQSRSRANSVEGSSQYHGGSSNNHGTSLYRTSSHNHGQRAPTHRRTSGRTAVAQGVASGQIGSGYGPYSYNPQQGRNPGVYGNGRFSATPSEGSASTHEHNGAQSPTPLVAPPPPQTTTVPQYMWDREPDLDDALHNPDPRHDNSWTPFSWRGWVNAFALFTLVCGLLFLFVGYPAWYFKTKDRQFHGYNIGGINGSGQIPDFPHLPLLIDPDTPKEALTRTGNDGHKYNLVFSDEFNRDGRTFYPGDDPFWEAVDLYYWQTDDWEWYDPRQITTENGALVITMEQRINHDLNFMSGMLQSWNKLCFTTGYIEVAISLPLSPQQFGLWPGAWTLGNLGRAGYGATNDGMWPYTYDTCDRGSFPFQMGKDGSPGSDVLQPNGMNLSSLPGQRLSACTCPGSDHPGPRYNVGRGVPEVDIIEAEINRTTSVGRVSQSLQVAPFNANYRVVESEPATTIYNRDITHINDYRGGQYQQAVSGLTEIDAKYYGGKNFGVYGYELWSNPDKRDEGFITWYSDGKPSWTLTAATVGADTVAGIGPRLIPEEPLSIILNLGISKGFQDPDFKHLTFPAKMYVDYVRIYQRPGVKDGLSCDPPKRPTKQYIKDHIVAYSNANVTLWANANFTFPRNSLLNGC
ncbi:beta-glucan synthesis-associated protein [Ephemerocybe angulata]|uniref:Beta-glucan synthesis-associated protein n=1 Tax=Ephemerocybe angulata TaxID=980116 RepID=A0A8H6M952_9AGAR|nr:beta-glucan synthesis-associated protein [Tulosesus angulatus]